MGQRKRNSFGLFEGKLYRTRAVLYRQNDGVALAKRHHLRTALHTRPLLSEHELTASEIFTWLGEQNRNLDWECEITVEVLVQAIEVTRKILQNQGSGARLPRMGTSL